MLNNILDFTLYGGYLLDTDINNSLIDNPSEIIIRNAPFNNIKKSKITINGNNVDITYKPNFKNDLYNEYVRFRIYNSPQLNIINSILNDYNKFIKKTKFDVTLKKDLLSTPLKTYKHVIEKGILGEAKTLKELYTNFPNLKVITDITIYNHQIDLLIGFDNIILMLENKSLEGDIQYSLNKKILITHNCNSIKINNPFYQVERTHKFLEEILDMKIESNIIYSSDNLSIDFSSNISSNDKSKLNTYKSYKLDDFIKSLKKRNLKYSNFDYNIFIQLLKYNKPKIYNIKKTNFCKTTEEILELNSFLSSFPKYRNIFV